MVASPLGLAERTLPPIKRPGPAELTLPRTLLFAAEQRQDAMRRQPGVYRFLTETGMAGKWELILTAKVQGEAGPVTGKITYDAK
jgi:hypothetical protein